MKPRLPLGGGPREPPQALFINLNHLHNLGIMTSRVLYFYTATRCIS